MHRQIQRHPKTTARKEQLALHMPWEGSQPTAPVQQREMRPLPTLCWREAMAREEQRSEPRGLSLPRAHGQATEILSVAQPRHTVFAAFETMRVSRMRSPKTDVMLLTPCVLIVYRQSWWSDTDRPDVKGVHLGVVTQTSVRTMVQALLG